ncbi:chemotaxis protein CheW [Gottschalkia acidurici]|nr:chemotaxis protein CheW [Gottschalkia acidurici]
MNENIVSDKKYVVFKLEDEFYGIDINNVRAIEKAQDFTRVPNAKSHIKGVINLRGEVVPIIELRKRFGLSEKEIDSNSRIIIVFLNEIQVGMLVDSSSEVIEFNTEDLDSAPSSIDTAYEDFVKCIGKKDGRLIILLSTEKVIGIQESEENN